MVAQEATAVGVLHRRGPSWQEAEELHQAVVTYFELVEFFPETDEARRAREQLLGLAQRTDEARRAREQLLGLAQRFEAEGTVYMATHINNRLASIG